MDKIYSRKKIRLPMIKYNRGGEYNLLQKIIKIMIILVIAIAVMINTLKAVDPILTEACKYKAKEQVMIEINKITTENIIKYENTDMIKLINDENGNIKLLQVNSNPLNNMISDITSDIQIALKDEDIINTNIPFGSITGIKYISGIGPRIPIRIASAGIVDTKIRNEFDDAGINQTIHRLWLEINCKITILTPYKVDETEVKSEVILSENVIIGGVPDVYVGTTK